MMKYFYTILGSNLDYYKACYNDIKNFDYALYDYKSIYTKNDIEKLIYRIHTSEQINKIIDLPLKSIWNSKLIKFDTKGMPVCFIFFTNTKKFERINDGFIEYLKSKFPNSKFVCIYQDVIALKRKISIEQVKKIFDLVISFDIIDCRKYDLIYYPDVYSKVNIESSSKESDIYFVGRAKDRFNEIIEAYNYFENNGFSCDFNIMGVPKQERIAKKNIRYLDKNIPYREILESINNTKAILEIMQGGAAGYTLRTCEAITYDKLLITNNKEILNAPFYNPHLIKLISKNNYNISNDDINAKHIFDDNLKTNLSPLRLLEFIDNYFIINNEVNL